MSDIEPKLLFKCPGSRVGPYGVLHDHIGVSTTEDEERMKSLGWCDTLSEAAETAEKAGRQAFKRSRIVPKRTTRMTGLPSVSHLMKAEAAKAEEKPEEPKPEPEEKIEQNEDPEKENPKDEPKEEKPQLEEVPEKEVLAEDTDAISMELIPENAPQIIEAVEEMGLKTTAKTIGVAWQTLNAFIKKNKS